MGQNVNNVARIVYKLRVLLALFRKYVFIKIQVKVHSALNRKT